MAGPMAIPYLLVSWHSKLEIVLVFKQMVPGFFGCFILFGLTNDVFKKLRIINFHLSFESKNRCSLDMPDSNSLNDIALN